jgi:RNA polymerase sigma factor (sigma-70 family)
VKGEIKGMENTSSGTNDVVTNALDKYADMVRRICYIYLRNQADVEDIFQNVFLKLLQHTDKFENEEHKKAWLCRVSINQCKDFHKSFFRKNVCSIDDVDLLYEDEVENEVMREVLSLPPKYKDVIYLFYYEGYTVPEIAKLLGKKENTVYSHLHRAKAILKEKLGGFEHGNSF